MLISLQLGETVGASAACRALDSYAVVYFVASLVQVKPFKHVFVVTSMLTLSAVKDQSFWLTVANGTLVQDWLANMSHWLLGR